MSAYDYDYDDAPRRHRTTRTRDREPEYVEETTYIQRGPGRPSTDLVYRARDDSIEDIPRDFPPQAEYRRTKYRDEYGPPRRARSARRRDEDYYDDEYSEFGPAAAGAAGAAAGYAAGRRRRRDRRYRDDDYISDDYAESTRERRKSKITETLEDLGLGGVVGAIAGKAASSRSRSRGARSRRGSFESDRSTRSRARSQTRGDGGKKWQQAATAALLTGAVEAWRSRKEPGGITGPKGRRIATAALSAAGIDAFLDKDPHEKTKRHVVESVIGGLAANRLANGPRSRSGSRGRSLTRDEDDDGRSRSQSRFSLRSLSRGRFGRSQSRGPDGERRGSTLKDIAALGGIAAAGKAIYDRVRSKSRNRDRDRSRSDSEDSNVPTRRQRYQNDRGAPPNAYNDDDRVARPRGRSEEGGERKRDGSSDSVSTTDLENQRKRTRGKELLTAGLATVATIHAAHGVYSSMVASEKRHKLVMEGEISPEEARKRKSKNMLQDAAAVGIAALGIKSAFSEWKEMNEQRHGVKELEEKRRKRRKAREKREREQRQNGYGQPPNAYAYPVPPAAYPAPAYADGNPYASAAGIPPPPMGTSQNRY